MRKSQPAEIDDESGKRLYIKALQKAVRGAGRCGEYEDEERLRKVLLNRLSQLSAKP